MPISRLNKLRGLSQKDRGLLLQAVLLLPAVHAALLLLGYSRLRQAMERFTPLTPGETPVPEAERILRAQEIARVVSIASRHGLYQATCLRRSLLAWWFLRREGIAGELQFGVRLVECKLEAHAWVEYNGAIINDSADIRAQYQPLYGALPANEPGL